MHLSQGSQHQKASSRESESQCNAMTLLSNCRDNKLWGSHQLHNNAQTSINGTDQEQLQQLNTHPMGKGLNARSKSWCWHRWSDTSCGHNHKQRSAWMRKPAKWLIEILQTELAWEILFIGATRYNSMTNGECNPILSYNMSMIWARAREVSSCPLVKNRTISPMTKLEKPIFYQTTGCQLSCQKGGS